MFVFLVCMFRDVFFILIEGSEPDVRVEIRKALMDPEEVSLYIKQYYISDRDHADGSCDSFAKFLRDVPYLML